MITSPSAVFTTSVLDHIHVCDCCFFFFLTVVKLMVQAMEDSHLSVRVFTNLAGGRVANSYHHNKNSMLGSELAGHFTVPQSAPLSSQALRRRTADPLSVTPSGCLTGFEYQLTTGQT